MMIYSTSSFLLHFFPTWSSSNGENRGTNEMSVNDYCVCQVCICLLLVCPFLQVRIFSLSILGICFSSFYLFNHIIPHGDSFFLVKNWENQLFTYCFYYSFCITMIMLIDDILSFHNYFRLNRIFIFCTNYESISLQKLLSLSSTIFRKYFHWALSSAQWCTSNFSHKIEKRQIMGKGCTRRKRIK